MKIVANSLKFLVAMAIAMVVSFSAHAAKPPEVIELNRLNTYVWSNEVSPVTTDEFMAALIGKRILLDRVNPYAKLYVVIVSGGGSYEHALVMKRLISQIPYVTLICKYCASAAGFIFATTPGTERLAIKKSQLLMHEMYLPHFTAQNAKNPAIMKDLIKSSDEFNAAMYTKIGMSKADYEKKIINKDWILNGDELVKHKLADKLVNIKCDVYVNTLAPDTCSSNDSK